MQGHCLALKEVTQPLARENTEDYPLLQELLHPLPVFLAFVPHAFSFCIGGVSFLAFFFDLVMQFLLAKRASFYSGGEKRRNLLEPEHLSIPSLR